MAKLIFTSRYLKDAKPSQKENYVHYIGTRKGVEKIDTSKKQSFELYISVILMVVLAVSVIFSLLS